MPTRTCACSNVLTFQPSQRIVAPARPFVAPGSAKTVFARRRPVLLAKHDCTDISSDPDHCRACAIVCESGLCESSSCTNPTMTCASGLTLRDNNYCVDLLTNPSNCGACNSFCVECAGGICCGLGLEACGEFCINPEVDLNCGGCGNICSVSG